jgi:hypothetical protein
MFPVSGEVDAGVHVVGSVRHHDVSVPRTGVAALARSGTGDRPEQPGVNAIKLFFVFANVATE